jgi:regulator of protease activity HflC (stomatin/prohibitin superfamily)
VIKASEARKQQQINEAEGQGQAILTIANATAEGIRSVASAIGEPGGLQAVNLRVAEQYIDQFGNLAKEGNSLIIPQTLSDAGSFIAAAMKIIKESPSSDSRV